LATISHSDAPRLDALHAEGLQAERRRLARPDAPTPQLAASQLAAPHSATVQFASAGVGGGRLIAGIDSERMYRRARRHSRLVRTLRLAIPLVLLFAALVTAVVATLLNPLRALAKLPVDIGKLVVSGTKITMQAPRLAGFTADARPYVVTARAAAQDILKPDLLELQDIHATMQMQDKSSFEVTARNGLYDTKGEKLQLQNNILVVTAKYRAVFEEALVNTRGGHMISERPVEVQMLQGTINANRMELINSGEIIRFERGVTMVVTLESSDAEITGGTKKP
jgi:lipopolysaccharide export system protein LptC